MKRVITLVLLLALSVSASLVLLSGCAFGGKTVPVYTGMSISSIMSSAEANAYLSDGKDDFDYDKDEGNHNGHFKGDSTERDEQIDGENPFPENEPHESVEEEIKTSLEIIGSDKRMYYATPGEDIYITIHINNPDDFEIVSFTLNGKKYSDYMFEDGSDMENIILKYNVGMESGIVEYTIDAIKYIDGTTIKDVTIGGSKTVTAGIWEENQVSCEVYELESETNAASMKISLSDERDLIFHNADGFVKVCIYDGDEIVGVRDINIGESEVLFDNLKTNTLYQYAVVAYYDDLIGEGIQLRALAKGAFYTDSLVLFDGVTVSSDSVAFDFKWNDTHPTKELISLKLYKDGELVRELSTGAREVGELLSNTTYEIVAEYDNAGVTESITLEALTATKVTPSFSISDESPSHDGYSASLSVTDTDLTLKGYTVTVELYSDNSLVATSPDGSIAFSSLSGLTDYILKVNYTYDLGDGCGLKTGVYKTYFTTHPYVDTLDCNIINTSTVVMGDTLYMQLNIDNPHALRVESVVINGETYAVTGSSTKTKLYVEILCGDQFGGGETELTVEKINLVTDDGVVSVSPETVLSDTVFINGALDVVKVELVNAELEPITWAFPNEPVYALVTLDNPTGYTVDCINLITGLTKIDDNRYLYQISVGTINGNWVSHTVTGITYHNENLERSESFSVRSGDIYVLSSSEIKYISTPEDLKSASDGFYYELTQDIDLSGLNWIPSGFSGILNGCGYSVKNMSYVGTYRNNHAYFGLFSSGTGIIENLNIENATIVATVTSDDGSFLYAYGSALVGQVSAFGSLYVYNCTVDADTSISVTNRVGNCYVGAIIGSVENADARVIGCESFATVSAATLAQSRGAVASGIVGRITGLNYKLNIENCANHGAVSASCDDGYAYAGGILAVAEYETEVTVKNCVNSGFISSPSGEGSTCVGGIIGYASYSNLHILSCINTGMLDAENLHAKTGGIFGYCSESDSVMEDCYSTVIGIGGYGGTRITYEELNEADFYTETLDWSEDVWSFTDLDTKNGKVPTLKH